MERRVNFPTLAGEISKRGIRKSVIAARLNINDKTLYNKLYGTSDFTWDEIKILQANFFPDMDIDTLMS